MNNTFNNIRQYLKNKLNNYLQEVKIIFESKDSNPDAYGTYHHDLDYITCKENINNNSKLLRHVLLHERFHATGKFGRLNRFSLNFPNARGSISVYNTMKEYFLFQSIDIDNLERNKSLSVRSLYNVIEEAIVERAICLHRGKLFYDYDFKRSFSNLNSYEVYYSDIRSNNSLLDGKAEYIILNIEKEARKAVNYHRKALFLNFLRKFCLIFNLV